MVSELTRRQMVGALASPLLASLVAASPLPLAIRVVGSLDRDTRDGVTLGLREAGDTARLIGRTIREATGAAAASAGEALIAVLGPAPANVPRGVPAIVLAPPAFSAASAQPRPSCVFFMAAPTADRAALLNRWRASHRTEAETTAPAQLTIEDWHPSLARFGASEISLRFKRAMGRPMNSAAWRGWCAVKAATEAGLQVVTTPCDALSTLRFDAHKGEALSFDARTGVLRQPLYVVRHRGADSDVVGTVS